MIIRLTDKEAEIVIWCMAAKSEEIAEKGEESRESFTSVFDMIKDKIGTEE